VTPRANPTFVNPVVANTAAGVNSQNVVITPELFTRLYLEGLVHQSVNTPPVATLPPVVPPVSDDEYCEGTPEVGRDRQKKYLLRLKPYDHRKETFESYFQEI